MSDEVPKSMRIIGPEDLQRFHDARNVTNRSCDRCETDKWTIISDKQAPGNGIPSAKDDQAADPTLFVPVLMLVCQNCGNLWIQSYMHIEHWLEANPSNGGGQ